MVYDASAYSPHGLEGSIHALYDKLILNVHNFISICIMSPTESLHAQRVHVQNQHPVFQQNIAV